ncbi:PREDICTED: DDB1- and CUL4-associated factor 8 isoform X1 [Theobroma cacao]|uniref:DDB1- and CUL4-associated factor 8 isoform X1 n=1 Tax=Theobroma cacao TaxID=3641 RepID=A0AB32VX49_THECC|nr:PREDICTED: DDB1- and CUL4-associated factor 8 isoform X1 [Theobroma cacao]
MMKNKRSKTSVDKAVVDVWQREVGELSTRSFAHRLAASEDLVLRLEIYKKLEKHRGCVNTVSFNADGNILVSGSDDKLVVLWDWETGHAKLSFQSGHVNNVFQAKIMPYTDDRSLVTCAADGQVRHAQILERGVKTRLLAKHQGRAHKLAIEPGSPHIFYTCGEDGLVQHIDLRTAAATELFTCLPIDDTRPVIHLNAIAIDPRNPNLFAVAGSDEYARLYDIRKYKWDGSTEFGQPTDYFCPAHLIGDEHVGITGLAFSDQSELLVSYNDEFIYLFTQDMGLGPNPVPSSPLSACSEASEMELDHSAASASAMEAGEKASPLVYKGHRNCETVKGVSFFGPKSEYVVSGSDCGRIFIWKKKSGELIRVMEADKHVVNCIEPHPHTTVLASSGIEKDIKIWTPKAIDKATLPTNIEQVPKPALFRWLSFAAFDEDDDDNNFIGIDDDDEDDDEEDDSDDDYDDVYDEIDDEEDDDNDDDNDDDDDDDGDEDVDGGDDSDCSDDVQTKT